MKKWIHEDWNFRIEAGDVFECTYETPAGFCPTAFIKIFPAMESVRCNGDRHIIVLVENTSSV